MRPEIVVAMAGKGGKWGVAAAQLGTRDTLSRNVGEQASNCRAMWFALEAGLDMASEPSIIVSCYTDVLHLDKVGFRGRDIDVQGRVYLKLGHHESVFRHKRDIQSYERIKRIALSALMTKDVWTPDPDETDRAFELALHRKLEAEASKVAKKAAFWNAYNGYLQSEEWQAMRLKVIHRDGGKCQACSRPGSHVHHLTYARVFNEDLEDLQLLCFECHDFIHDGKLSS